MLSHSNLASNALTLVDYWRFTKDDVLLHALPIFHTHGLFVASNIVLLTGAKMIFLNRFDADEVIRQLPRSTNSMRSEEHTSELKSLMRSSYAVSRLKKKN